MRLVNRRSSIAQILAVLCLVALSVVQSFGVVRGYVCRCGGQQSYTKVDHCHGPHTMGCHQIPDEAASVHHGGEPCDGEREDHEQIREDVQWVQSSSRSAPATMPAVVAVLPEFEFARLQTVAARVAGQRWERGDGPARSVAIARTVVLLI